MTYTIMQLMKEYRGNAPLINSMVKPPNQEFRTVACYLAGRADGNNGMERVAAETLYLGLRKSRVNWTRLSTCRQLARLIDEHEVDLLVCQFRRVIPIGVIAARLSTRRPKVVGVLHGIVGGKVGFGRKVLNYFIFKRLAKLVSVSDSGIQDILRLNIGLDPGKLVAIANGLDCEPFLAPAPPREAVLPEFRPEHFVFGMVGRLAPVKNQERALRALARLAPDFPQARMAIVGAGPLEQHLKELVAELDLETRVNFLGYRADIPAILQSLDCYLMPSLREGFPMALMEAMVSGLPVITSRVGGMYELVPDENHGLLVDPLSVESITQAMKRALENDPGRNRELGQNAKARILEHFTAEQMADAYENLYREILSQA